MTGVPLAGVIPLVRDHGLPDEDGLFDAGNPNVAPAGRLRIAVLCPPHISNLDEFEPLRHCAGVQLAWVPLEAELHGADWIVLPGSKQVSGDLAWLRRQGLDGAIARHAAAGRPVLGICGGLQILGEALVDPDGHDGEAGFNGPGLGLLPLVTRYERDKRVRRSTLRFAQTDGAWAPWAGVEAAGYEIHCGSTSAPSPDLPARAHGTARPRTGRIPSAGRRAACWASTRTACSNRPRCCARCGARRRRRWTTASKRSPISSTNTWTAPSSIGCSRRAGRMAGFGA